MYAALVTCALQYPSNAVAPSSDDLNKALLVPQLPTSSQAGSDQTPSVKAALILDSESDLRDLDRQLREIETLDKRGTAGAGKLQGISLGFIGDVHYYYRSDFEYTI